MSNNLSYRKVFAIVANLSWLVIVVTFVLLLGGTHPSGHAAEIVLVFATLLIICFNLPIVIFMLISFIKGDALKANLWGVFWLLLRAAAAYFIFGFIAGRFLS